MDFKVEGQLLCLVPDDKKEEVRQLYESFRRQEVARLRQQMYREASHECRAQGYGNSDKNDCEARAEKMAIPLTIAHLIMDVWSPAMRCHAETLILEKAIQEKYLEERHRKYVLALDQKKSESKNNGWIISNKDDVIIELIWDIFDIKQHFEQVSSHRMWIHRSYTRLKQFVPGLSEAIIDRHDLTKYAFNQAIGYTLKWVYNISNGLWKTACDLHLHNEPHHPHMWSKTPAEKREKLYCWMKDVCDFHNGCSRDYDLDIESLDLEDKDFANPFLLESYIDMVAVEWERKKEKRMDISIAELAYMDDRYLLRYSLNQRKIIKKLMNNIMDAHDSCRTYGPSQKRKKSESTGGDGETVDLSQFSNRERKLLSTVPKERQVIVSLQMIQQKKEELERLQAFTGNRQSLEAEKKQADDTAFCITISKVVLNDWNPQFRSYVQALVLNKAITEGFIKEDHLKWISVVEQRGRSVVDPVKSLDVTVEDSELVQLIWIDFNMREHFSQVASHRHWVMQSFLRLSSFIPALPEEVIERHDLSKFAFSQAIGYTLMMVHDINHPIWKTAYNRHMHGEPHHPELWSNRHTPEYKVSCLESWLCAEAGCLKYGVQVNHLNFYTDNMPIPFLLESLIDVVAIEWERKKGKRLDIANAELVTVADRAFNRHTEADYRYVKAVIKKISDLSVV